MKRSLTVFVVAALAIALVAGCAAAESATSIQVAVAGPPAAASADGVVDPYLPQAVNSFGLNLARQFLTDGQNTVISPLSVHAALSMTSLGARGNTSEEMLRTLSLDVGDATVGGSYADLLGELYEPEGVTLAIANSLWAQQDAPFEQTFLDANREFFGAEIRTLDLQAPEAADEINAWVAEKTHDRITEIIDQPDPAAVMELVNAVYFLGDWATPFEEGSTLDWPFQPSQGEPFDVPLMYVSGSWSYAESADAQLVRMPYANDDFAAYVLLPKEGSTPTTLLSDMSAEDWESMRTSLTETEGSIALPRCEIEWGENADLKTALIEMGMPSPFDYTTADFSGISAELDEDPGLEISRVLHKTYLAINETGTEAAAATDVEMTLGSVATPPADSFELRADHPFIFAISHEPSGALLFLGVIEDPRG